MSISRPLLIGLCTLCAFSLLRAAQAVVRASLHVKADKALTYGLNRLRPNGQDRNTDWDYVDRRGWADVASEDVGFARGA